MAHRGLTPIRLCLALAEALGPVLPDGMALQAQGELLVIQVPTAPILGMTINLGSLLADFNEDDVLSDGQITHGCLGVLDDVQETAVQVVRAAWPLGRHRLETPAVRIQDDKVVIWFGEEDNPALILAPIALA